MTAGEFFVSTDSGDVVLVYTDFDGGTHRWAIAPAAALDLAARMILEAYNADPEAI